MELKPNQNPFPHLKISENVYEAIKGPSKEEWAMFFDSFKHKLMEKIETCSDADLTKERGKLTLITEVQGVFLGIKQHTKAKQQ